MCWRSCGSEAGQSSSASSRVLEELSRILPLRPLDLGDAMRRFEFDGKEYAVFEIDLNPPEGLEGLTPAEREVAEQLVGGWTYAQIARAGKKSVNTVGKHAARIYKKLGVRGRWELARALGASQGRINVSNGVP
jgi:DNA-binding CsgD family transcriptional regulator